MQSPRDQADANINMASKIAVGHCDFSELSRVQRVAWRVLQARCRRGTSTSLSVGQNLVAWLLLTIKEAEKHNAHPGRRKNVCCWTAVISAAVCTQTPEERLPFPQPFERYMDFEIILRSEKPKGIPFSNWRVSARVTTKSGMPLP